MTLQYDPEFAEAFVSFVARLGEIEQPETWDVAAFRALSRIDLPLYGKMFDYPADVGWTPIQVMRTDGSTLHLRWYEKAGSSPGSAAVYAHGGGMIMASLDDYDAIVARYVADSGVPMLAVEYRLAPEHPFPEGRDDCLRALEWLAEEAPTLGIDPGRIAIMGDSGGGCLAAQVALAARDLGGPPLAKQILVYPQLDDRTRVADPHIESLITCTYTLSAVAWDAVLGDTDPAAQPVAPARAQDLSDLPTTYIDVGELDIFRAEDVDYAARLSAAGVSVELHVHPGVPHAFELVAPDISVSRRVLADRCRALASF
jgi:acetyl esterase/lipase